MRMETRFEPGYSIVVVGGGSGIGAAAARTLAARGASLTVADRDGNAARDVARRIEEAGGGARGFAADVTDPGSLVDVHDAALAWAGTVHAVINTVGVQGPLGRPSHEVELDAFEATLRVNLTGALALTRVVVPHMLEQGYGRIAHLSSIAGKEGNPNMVAYSASKAGLIGMVKTQGKEYAGTGVTVNALAPAVIHTPFLDTQPQPVVDYMIARIPMGRVGTVDEVADILTFMVSPACSFTTGFTFDLSGGRATY